MQRCWLFYKTCR